MPTEQENFSGKIIAITGAGFDVGRALSLALATQGATIILIDKSPKALNAVYDEMMASGVSEPIIAELDLAKLEEPAAQFLAQQIFEQFGKLDALIHAAQWAFPLAPLALYEAEAMQNAWQRLYFSPWLLSKSLLPVLSHAGTPKILFTLYEYARRENDYWGAYGAAFSSLESTIDIWNKELNNKNIYIDSVPLNDLATQMRKKHFPAENPSALTLPQDERIIQLYFDKLLG